MRSMAFLFIGRRDDGKPYTAYEATQMQRRLECTIRKQKRRVNGLEDVGAKDDATAAKARLRKLNAKYKEFSEAAGLPEQWERTRVTFVDDATKAEAAAKELKNQQNRAILKEKIQSGEISTKLKPQVQARHVEGTPQFKEYLAQRLKKGKTPQSILTVTMDEAQNIVDKYSGTGIVIVKTNKDKSVEIREYANIDKVIGKEYTNNKYRKTKRVCIVYSKNGTHIFPVPPKKEGQNGRYLGLREQKTKN